MQLASFVRIVPCDPPISWLKNYQKHSEAAVQQKNNLRFDFDLMRDLSLGRVLAVAITTKDV